MKTQLILAVLLLLNVAFVSSIHGQATSVKRITKQLPPGSVPSPSQPPSAPVPPAKPGPPSVTPPARTAVPVAPAAPAAAVKTKTDAEKAELLKKTIKSERKRAEGGSDAAQYDVGMRYFRGDGVEKNLEEARKWLEMSAKQGHETAAKRLEDVKALLKP